MSQNKKEINKWTSTAMEVISFFMFLLILVIVYCYVILCCKVAQAHILPNAMDGIPYTRNKFILEDKDNPIYFSLGYDEEGKYWSEEIYFPLLENYIVILQSYLGNLYDFIYNKNGNFFKLFIGNTLQNMLVLDFIILTVVYNLVNRYLPDFLILFFGIFILKVIFFICFICNVATMTFLWGYNLSVFFYDAKYADDSPSEIEWIPQSITAMSFILLLMDPMSLIEIMAIISTYFSIGWCFIIPLVSFLVTIYCFVFPFYIVCREKNEENNMFTIFTIIRKFFMYRSSILILLICFYIFCRIYCNFGYLEGIYWLVAVLVMYFFTEMFENKKVVVDPKLNLIEGAYFPEQTTKRIIEERISSIATETRKLIHLADSNFPLPVGFNNPESAQQLNDLSNTMSTNNVSMNPPSRIVSENSSEQDNQVNKPEETNKPEGENKPQEENKPEGENKSEETNKPEEAKNPEGENTPEGENKTDEEKKQNDSEKKVNESKAEEVIKEKPTQEEKKSEVNGKYINNIEESMKKVKEGLETINNSLSELKKT
jgi:hypothetical protein